MSQHNGRDDGYKQAIATQMLTNLLQSDTPYEEHLHRNLLLAGQHLADDLPVETAVSNQILDRLAGLMLETPIEPLRKQIASLALKMDDTVYKDAITCRLLVQLEDESAKTRAGAARALGKIGSKRAVDDLLPHLEDEIQVRKNAAWALGEIGDQRAIEGLLAHLGDENVEVRRAVISALGEFENKQVAEGLLIRLEDSHVYVRGDAARVLGKFESKEAISIIVDHFLARLKDNQETEPRMIIQALGKIDNEKMASALAKGLLPRLECEKVQIRRWVARGLAELETGLATLKSENAIKSLLVCLEDKDACVRQSAAVILGKVGDERAVNGLLACLEDDDESARRIAALPGTSAVAREIQPRQYSP